MMNILKLIIQDKLFYIVVALLIIIGYAIDANKQYNSDLLNTYYQTSGIVYQQNDLRHQLIRYAQTFMGTPYQYAGKGPENFDCSGFTGYVFKHFNINLPASSILQSRYGNEIELKEAGVGDLIFFKGLDSNDVGHIGIIVSAEPENINFIHSSTSRGVVIDNLNQDYYKDRFLGVRDVID